MKHWANQYIGVPYDELSYNCWSFFRHIQKRHYGITVPNLNIKNHRDSARLFKHHSEKDNWIKVDYPKDGDGVMMSYSKYPIHIGVYIKDTSEGILHCIHNHGVVFMPSYNLSSSGWKVTGYYRNIKRL